MRITPLESWICKKISVSSGGLTDKALAQYQLEKLNWTIHYARKNSQYYKNHLNKMPANLRSLKDIERFPFLTANDLQAHSKDIVCVSQGEISRIVTLDTSGTTGSPKRIYFTPEDQELTIDFFGVGMSTLVDEMDRVLILLPDSTPGSVGDLLFSGLQRIGAKPVKHGPIIDLQETLSVINKEKITSLVGAPTQVLALSRYCDQKFKDNPPSLKSVLLSTDHVPDSLARTLQRTWNCRVFNHYGMTEMGLGGGVFCEADYGYHLREADMYFEIIDPISGIVQPDGVYGELVFSTLTRTGMPLIRYRTGDLTRFLPLPCSCSSKLRTLEKITKRVEQSFRIGSEKLFLSDFDEILFSFENLINFKMEIHHLGNKDIIGICLYSLQQLNDYSMYYDAIVSLLNRKQVNSGLYQLQLSSILGYQKELTSLRKRKVIEKFQQQF